MPAHEHPVDLGLEVLHQIVREDAVLARELEESLPEFFRGSLPAQDPVATLAAARRHREWFLLERHSPALRGAPVEALAERWRERVDSELEGEGGALLSSFTGIFEVVELREGGYWLRDLAGLGQYAISDPEAAQALEAGDLIVGRLFPTGGGLHHVSPAAGFFREQGLRLALERDLQRLRAEGGRGKVLRLSQRELETMFWGAGRPAAPRDPVGEARALLQEAGIPASAIDALFQRLRAHPLSTSQLAPGAGDTLGEVLEELAFESDVDLEAARRLLLAAWVRWSTPQEPVQSRAESDDRRRRARAVEAFAQGRSQGGDLDRLLRDLERDLDLEGALDEALEEEAETPAPDFPGVVGAMVEEFLWEERLETGERASSQHRILEKLGRFGAHLGSFEDLSPRELLRFTTFWLLENDELASAREASDLLASLSAFCAWAEESHELPLRSQFQGTIDRLQLSLPRLARANRMRARGSADRPGELFEILAMPPEGGLLVADLRGEPLTVEIDPGLREQLAVGDRIRGQVDPSGAAVVYCAYPAEVAGLA